MNKKVLVPIADGTEEIEAVCVIDVLRRAGAEVTVASVSANLQITASRGTKIVADVLISECVDLSFDLVALPGGMPGSEHLRDSTELIQILKRQCEQGKLYGAICAAPVVVLQHHGLIGKKMATCYPSVKNKLENPDQTGARVVVDGNCVTSMGPATAMEFGLKLVELLFGAQKRQEIAKGLLSE